LLRLSQQRQAGHACAGLLEKLSAIHHVPCPFPVSVVTTRTSTTAAPAAPRSQRGRPSHRSDPIRTHTAIPRVSNDSCGTLLAGKKQKIKITTVTSGRRSGQDILIEENALQVQCPQSSSDDEGRIP
jgi:hypothetical protein